jgi:hypothetical protein
MSASDMELLALAGSWRARARSYMREAQESGNVRDIYCLAGMASSLDFAARELCRTVDIDPNDGPPVSNVEADRTPTFFVIVSLAEGLGADPVDLFTDAVARLRKQVPP